MANQIKLKRGSGSNPGTSDLVVGEVALRTDNGTLFTKKDDGNIAEIGAATGVSDGDKGDITVSNSGATFTIDNGVVTFAKMQNIGSPSFVGRNSSSTGVIENLSVSDVRTMLNVENGATADQTASEIVALIADQTIAPSAIDMEDDEKIKIGAGDDLEIYHLSNSSFILNKTGTLNILGDNLRLRNRDNDETYIRCVDDAAVELFFNNTVRIETTNAGATITGDATISQDLTVRGIAATGNFSINNTNPSITLLDDSHSFKLDVNSNLFAIRDNTNVDAIRFSIDDSGTVEVDGNLDVGAGLDVTGNITVTGTVDGRDLATDGSKLDGIESGATADQTASEILTLIKTVDGSGSGLDADTLDGISSASFVRSDVSDTLTGSTYIFSSSQAEKIILQGASSPYIRFQEGTTNKAYIQWNASGYLDFINQETNEGLRISSGSNGLQYRLDASYYTVWHSANDGSGSGLDSDTVDGIQASSFLRSDTSDTCSGAITFSADCSFSGGGGAVSIVANSDISFASGNWTGNHTKIQHHNNYLYIVGGSNGIIFRESGTNRAIIDGSGHFVPGANNTYNLGSSSTRWSNIYTNDLNLSNEGSKNDVDGTWGSYTIQEGEDSLFLINKRNGKKYKFNLTEVN